MSTIVTAPSALSVAVAVDETATDVVLGFPFASSVVARSEDGVRANVIVTEAGCIAIDASDDVSHSVTSFHNSSS